MFLNRRINKIIAEFLIYFEEDAIEKDDECKAQAINWLKENINILIKEDRYYDEYSKVPKNEWIASDLIDKYISLVNKKNELIFDSKNLLELYPEIKLWKINDKLSVKSIIYYMSDKTIRGCNIISNIYYVGFTKNKEIYVKFKIEDIEHIGIIRITRENGLKLINLDIYYRNLNIELENSKEYMKQLVF